MNVRHKILLMVGSLGAQKGGIIRSIKLLEKTGQPVPQSKWDELAAVDKKMAGVDKDTKAGTKKEGSHKRKRNMLDNATLDFEENEEPPKSSPRVLKTPKRSKEKSIELPIVIRLSDGCTMEMTARQKENEMDQTFG